MLNDRPLVVLLAFVLLAAFTLNVRAARKDAQDARSELFAVSSELAAVRAESAAQREIIAKSYEAIQTVSERLKAAGDGHAARLQKIDSTDSDWLLCALPDSLRDAFNGDQNRAADTAGDTIDAVR